MTLWGLLYNTRWLAEDDSIRHHYLARITPWDVLTRRGRLGKDHSMRQDDSMTLLSCNQNPKSSQGCLWGTSVLWIVLTSLLFFLFQSFEMFSLLLMTCMVNPLFLLSQTHFISFSIVYCQPSCLANFVTWMIMVLIVFSILFQDHGLNATNCTHKHSCSFSPCVQTYFSSLLMFTEDYS